MDAAPFFIYLILPFIFMLLALRTYQPGYENLKIFFYAISFVLFTVAGTMFIMHTEDGVFLQVFDPPPTVTTIERDCNIFQDRGGSVGNATGQMRAFYVGPEANFNPFADGSYAFDSVNQIFCFSTDFVPVGTDFFAFKVPFKYTIQIPNTVDGSVNTIANRAQDNFPQFVSAYDERRESDFYYLFNVRDVFDQMIPLVAIYMGLGAVMLIFCISEILTIRWNRSTI